MTDGKTATGPDGRPVELGPVGQEIVFENEQIRVWEIELEPGDAQPWHHHQNPYVVIALEAADNRIDSIKGGDPRLVPAALDISRRTYGCRLVELKCLGENLV